MAERESLCDTRDQEIARLKHALSSCVPWVAASGRGMAQEALIDACELLRIDPFDWTNHPNVLRSRLWLREHGEAMAE